MPWLSPKTSPTSSPKIASSPLFSQQLQAKSATLSLTYIPPLIDGACGTVSTQQQTLTEVFRRDARLLLSLLPDLGRALWWRFSAQAKFLPWTDVTEAGTHVLLAVFELLTIAAVVPLFLILPGILFSLWLAVPAAFVVTAMRLINSKQTMVRCSAVSDGWMMGQEAEDEKWIAIGWQGTKTHAGPTRLSKLLGRPVTGILTPSYGLPFDLLMLLVHRIFSLPTGPSALLYSEMRTALLNSSVKRVVVFAHNLGSVSMAHCLARLYVDIPREKLGKLEIYTFGSLAREFMLPVGETKGPKEHHHQEVGSELLHPHIEHFAHTSDPCARFGVLHNVRENLEGRYCGGVFVIGPPPSSKTLDGSATTTSSGSPAGSNGQTPIMTLDDYVSCLFPPVVPGLPLRQGVLNHKMAIDRDVAEKREFAAVARYASSSMTRKEGKRLSWTALGATVGGQNGVMDGVLGLELARKGCKDCNGHRGYEVSYLARYVNPGSYIDTQMSPILI